MRETGVAKNPERLYSTKLSATTGVPKLTERSSISL
jgi:hypothetical protein